MTRQALLSIGFTIVTIATVLCAPVGAVENLLVNGDFSQGSNNRPVGWRTESWIDRDTTAFSWIPPYGDQSGEVEISNRKLNDTRWVQSTMLSPGLYIASVEIFTYRIPPDSWAGAFISIGDQMVASLDVKGNSNWTTREVFFKVTRDRARADVKLRLAGFLNFAVGQAFFRNAVLQKIDRAPEGAMVLDLDANPRPWHGNPWTLLPLWLLVAATFAIGWRMLAAKSG